MNDSQSGLGTYQYFAIASVDDLKPGERLFIEIGERPIVLLNVAGTFYALGDVCTHDGGPLGDGEIEGFDIICPRHGARFDIRSGEVLSLPAVEDAPSYPVRITEGQIEIGVPSG
jgi:3-phenylpropionate/trans-cinnamate dioxygenase ferredoxin component